MIFPIGIDMDGRFYLVGHLLQIPGMRIRRTIKTLVFIQKARINIKGLFAIPYIEMYMGYIKY